MKKNRFIFTVIFVVCLLVSRTVVNNEHNILFSEDQKTYGYFDSIIFDIDDNQVEKLSKGLSVKRYGLFYTNSMDCILKNNGDTVKVGFFDEYAKDMVGYRIEEGEYPTKVDEIAVSRKIANDYHLEKGGTVELTFNNDTSSYKITGVINDYIGEWRSNINRPHDMKLLQMPGILVSDGSPFLKDSIINATVSMVKVSDSDTAVNTVDEFANYLFNNASGYEKHVYYSELSEQGYSKYKVFSGLGTDLALLAVTGFIISVLYLFERDDSTLSVRMGSIIPVITGILVAGAVCLIIGLIGGRMLKLSLADYVICSLLMTAIAAGMEFLIDYDGKNDEIITRGKKGHFFYYLYVPIVVFTVKLIRDLVSYGKIQEVFNIASFMRLATAISFIVCVCSWVTAGIVFFGKKHSGNTVSKGMIGLILLLTAIGTGLGLII